jgi:hypothetical protein
MIGPIIVSFTGVALPVLAGIWLAPRGDSQAPGLASLSQAFSGARTRNKLTSYMTSAGALERYPSWRRVARMPWPLEQPTRGYLGLLSTAFQRKHPPISIGASSIGQRG